MCLWEIILIRLIDTSSLTATEGNTIPWAVYSGGELSASIRCSLLLDDALLSEVPATGTDLKL